MLLLLAPPNTHVPLRVALHNAWQAWVNSAQDFLINDVKHLVAIILFAWLAFWLVKAISNRMQRAAERHSTAGLARTSQIRTLASVLRATGFAIVGFFTVISILRDVFDLNLAPLLASAGVAGVAIGLAAQTIVKDMINGMLVLMEDQYNVGDVVTIAGITGNVESMSLRKTTVRGFDGTLFLVPNSQITNVANQSRDFSSTTLNISVDFTADPDKVIALLNQIANDVRNEPAYKDVFLEDPKVLGVDQIKGSEVIYPVVVKTKARQQYDALRELQKRIRVALEQHNMLPGSPYRVLAGNGLVQQDGRAGQTPAQRAAQTPAETPAHDPTTNKPNEVNPFSGE